MNSNEERSREKTELNEQADPWRDARESYNKVTGKQIGIGQEARAGTRETKMDAFSLFLR